MTCSVTCRLGDKIGFLIEGCEAGIFEIKNEIQSAKQEMVVASAAYKPIHTEVRTIERMVRQKKKQIKALKLELREIDDPSKKAAIQEDIVAFEKEIAEQKKLEEAEASKDAESSQE